MITPLDLNDVQLRSGRILKKERHFVFIQEQDNSEEDSLKVNKIFEGTSLQNQSIEKEKQKEPVNSTPIIEHPISISAPPFPERLQVDRGVEKQIMLPNYDFLDELNNVCIKIPLLQAIKEIPILAKTIKELNIKKLGRKEKETKRIHLVGKIADIMMGKISIQKYVDPGSLL